MRLDDLSSLIDTTTLSKKWIINTNAKPTQAALWVVKGKLSVCAIYWKGNAGGTWDDEGAVSMTDIIIDLLPYYRDKKLKTILDE